MWRGLLIVALALGLGSCSGFRAGGYAGYIQPQVEGTIGLAPSTGGVIVGTVDTEDDLGLEREGSPYARIELGSPIVSATISGFTYDSTSSGVLQASFGDIPLGVAVDTDLKFTQLKGALTHDFQIGPVRLSPGIAVDYFDIDLDVAATGFSARESLDVQAPVPMLYLQAAVDVGPVAATLDVGGMDVDLDEASGTFIDVDGMLRFKPVDWLTLPVDVELFIGYRWISMEGEGKADDQDYDVDLTLSGLMFGGGFYF